jgi:hypothetical protein
MKVTMKIILQALILASLAAPAFGDDAPTDGCSICPEGSDMGNKGLELPFFADMTCGDLDFSLALSFEECADDRSFYIDLVDPVDLQAWCGCSGVELPGICSFCGSDDLVVDPEKELPDDDAFNDDVFFDDDDGFDDDANDDGFDDDDDEVFDFSTCGDLNSLAPFIMDERACSSLLLRAPFCCEATKGGKKMGKKGKISSSKGKKKEKGSSSKGGKKGKISSSKGKKIRKGSSSKEGKKGSLRRQGKK